MHCLPCCVQVDAVFNLELPSSAAHYAHRAGRTGRMGAPGLVISLVAPGERFVVERLSKKLGVPIMVRLGSAGTTTVLPGSLPSAVSATC
jgi:superfamily II DNA/RNA helicase